MNEKTIMDDIFILQNIKLPIVIKRENNKGYFIKKRLISAEGRDILIDLLSSVDGIDSDTFEELFNFITIDTPDLEKKEIKKNKLSNIVISSEESSLNKNLELIKEAIGVNRKISFKYLLFNEQGKLESNGISYIVSPIGISCIDGIYYLECSENLNASNLIKIRYMKDLKITNDDIKVEKKKNESYKFKVEILYKNTIDLIKDNFRKVKIYNDNGRIYADILTTYERAFHWFKQYGNQFLITDEEIRRKMQREHYLWFDNFYKNDLVKMKIKSAIVNYYYENPNPNLLDYEGYFKGLYMKVDEYLFVIGYKLVEVYDDVRFYESKEEKIKVAFSELRTNKYHIENGQTILINQEKEKRQAFSSKLLAKDDANRKYLVLLEGKRKTHGGAPFDVINFPKKDKMFIERFLIK